MKPHEKSVLEVARKQVRCNWLHCISEISDIGRQRVEWLREGQQSPYYSLVEYRQNYFDVFSDFSDVIENDTTDPVDLLSGEEKAAAAAFHKILVAYNSPNDDDWDSLQILDDPNWLAVCAEAKNAKTRLKTIVRGHELGCFETPQIISIGV